MYIKCTYIQEILYSFDRRRFFN